LDFGFAILDLKSAIQNPKIGSLTFPVHPMAAAAAAKLFELEPVWRVLFVLCRHVVALFALGAL